MLLQGAHSVGKFLMLPVVLCCFWAGLAAAAGEEQLPIGDVEADKARFVGYVDSISLSGEEEERMKRILSTIASPCCADHTANNCCGCRTAQSILGFSRHLVSQGSRSDELIRQSIETWIERVRRVDESCGKTDQGCCAEHEAATCSGARLESVVESCTIPLR